MTWNTDMGAAFRDRPLLVLDGNIPRIVRWYNAGNCWRDIWSLDVARDISAWMEIPV